MIQNLQVHDQILLNSLHTYFIVSLCVFAEIFADEKCSVLNNPDGIFAECHGHIPTDYYHRVTRLQPDLNPQLVLGVLSN